MGLSGAGLTTHSYLARVYLWADSRGRLRTIDNPYAETTTSTYKYYAFGDVLASTGTLSNPFKYAERPGSKSETPEMA
jgi:hypothetical protein